MSREDSDVFSLLDEPWIAAVGSHGEPLLVSIRQIFDGTHDIAELRGDSPAQDYAVLRVLLAIFWRAHSVSKPAGKTKFSMAEWFVKARADALEGAADIKVLSYLDGYANRFNLFDSDHPFMQVADLHTEKGSVSPINRIIPEAENEFFTMRAGKPLEKLSFGEAARWLVYVHAYDYSGIKSGAVGDSRVKGGRGYPIGTGWTGMTGGTYLIGANLRETLALNTTEACLRTPNDKPVWEREPDTAAERNGGAIHIGGPADLATWQTRRVRLHRENNEVVAVLVSNGDRIPDAGLNAFGDPMTPYRYSKNQSKKDFVAFYPRPYDAGRTMWRSLEPLIAMESDAPYLRSTSSAGKGAQAPKRPEILDQLAYYWRTDVLPPSVAHVGMVTVEYGAQSSSVAASVTARTTLNLPVLENDAVRRAALNAADVTLNAAIALGQFGGNLLVAAGGTYEFQAEPMDSALAQLEPAFNRWVAGWSDSPEPKEYAIEWQKQVRSFMLSRGEAMLHAAGPRAMIGRPLLSSTTEKPQIVTAASYFSLFGRKLGNSLPLLSEESKKKEMVNTND
ncbi:type I-E CRISPR-associated protein Cse1/CasA [Corynebacterium striatum]|uniref:type I-E CRISPR-associated protein Cse1/CasA n=1 Tax=Corynebacterium striatum TaxID=43770 RepID=UPI002550E7B4|nr:type I-E CRISPR-associated protein Cse1/CasA [Corynebacterium striatum]MDK7884287.1 type I-E CRISPR-associated protein Cse1/CasA [Corynebacterium striatum]